MSAPPSKIWLTQAGLHTWAGHAESTGGDAVFYHIPNELVEHIRAMNSRSPSSSLIKLLAIFDDA